MRVLVLQLKRIGDLVLTAPALRALRQAGAHTTLVVTRSSAPVLPLLSPHLDAALVYGSAGGNTAVWRQVWRGSFDACVDFTGRDRSALLTLASHARQRLIARAMLRTKRWRRVCYNTVLDVPVRSRHTVDYYLEQLAPLRAQLPALDLTAPARVPVLQLPPAAVTRADELLAAHNVPPGAPFVIVHPGSARPEKYWEAERWAEVIAFCQQTLGLPCVLTGGRHDPCEEAHLARVQSALSARAVPCANLAGQLDLPELAAVFARATLFLGVDSGPAHLAAAWNRPQIVLFGPTNPFHWRPRHPAGFVLQAGQGDAPVRVFTERSPAAPVEQISTRAVIGAIKALPLVPARS